MKSIWGEILQIVYNHTPYSICTWIFRHIDYFHYKSLTRFEHPVLTKSKLDGIVGNECYGNLWAVKNALKENFHPNCMIEHGVYFGENVLEKECTIPSIDTIYTYGEYRRNAILKWFNGKLDKKIVTVGPYILYADNFKSKEQLRKLKNKFGKVLLVFPSHSYPYYPVDYDMTAFLEEVEYIAKDYDSVLVSLYWADIRLGRDKMYVEKGYKVVCSGTRTDRWFLCRLRDLFELADFSMGNDVGTHVGYSIAMGVPHYIFNQLVVERGTGKEYGKGSPIVEKEYEEIRNAFSIKEPIITKEQLKVVSYYWGL